VISPAHRAMAMDTEFGGGLHLEANGAAEARPGDEALVGIFDRSVHGVLPFVAFT
jgi:hypothetical protein